VRFAEHDEAVERFVTYRSDEPLNVPVLPRRAWRRRAIADPHCTNASGVRGTECAVAVPNQVTQRFVPGKGISHLSRDPLGGRERKKKPELGEGCLRARASKGDA
jgi:hypothetical protein